MRGLGGDEVRLQSTWLSELSLYQVESKTKAERNKRLGALFRYFGKRGYTPSVQDIQTFFKDYGLSSKEASSLRRSFIYRLDKNNEVKASTQKNTKETQRKVYLNSARAKKSAEKSNSKEVFACPQLKAILLDINLRRSEEDLDKGEQTSIEEGFVYLLEHPLYPGWVKAGMTVDYIKRMELYNQADPLSRYRYIDIHWVSNRRDREHQLLSDLAQQTKEVSGEWFFLDSDVALQVIRQLLSR